jgi:hypothetical protein
MIARLFICLLCLGSVAACSHEQKDLKSPCVGAEGSPCDRRPVNIGHS